MKRALSILLAALLLLFALPTVAEEGALQPGLYVSDAGTELLYLYEEGVGVLVCPMDGLVYSNGVVWTGDSLEIERTPTPFATTEGVLSFTYGGAALALRYKGAVDGFVLGEPAGYAFAGEYAAEDGKALSLTGDGRGVYQDAAGEKPVFWGSFLSYFESDELTAANCYILFDSFLGAMDFVDGGVQVDTETEGRIAFAPAAAPEAPEGPQESRMTLISPAFDLSLSLPVGGWTVEETEAGLVAAADGIQYTFLSVALDKAPDAATLDAYADHLWTDGLMGVGVAYEAAETVRADHPVGQAAGRAAATEWIQDDGAYRGDSVLWYANGRLYAALCVSAEDARPVALAMLDAALMTFRSAEEAEQSAPNRLPLDKGALESLQELPPVQASEDQVYYGYRLTTGGQSIDLVPFLTAMGMDPRSICLTLRADGTGSLRMGDDEETSLTWTEDTLSDGDEELTYTREGGHICITMGDEAVEFAPAAEMEPLLAEASASGQKGETVVPAAAELAGGWTFTKARAMGLEIPAAQMGTSMSLVLNEDGTAVLLTDGAPAEMTWTVLEDGKVSLSLEDTEVLEFVYDGTVLILVTVTDSVQMVFEKDN